MPPLPSVPQVFRSVVRSILAENIDVICRQFWTFTGVNDNASTQAFCNAVSAAWAAHIVPMQTGEITFTDTEVEDLSAATAPAASTSSGVNGGVASNPLPANCAVVIKKLISRRYRGGHPRNYIAGISEVDILDAQRLDPTRAAAWLAAYTAFSNALNSHTFGAITIVAEANVSYWQGFTNHTFPSGRVRPIPNPRPGGPIVDHVNAYAINPKVGSQRRRTLQSS